jgi:hypothetical protein
MHDLHVRCSGSVGWALSALFQRGVLVPVTAGTRLTDFLLISLEIPRADLEERVQTIFLDGRPVDDPATAVMGPGSVVALSASLPGLVGATMRKGGTYASLRSSISHTEAAREDGGRESGLATLKLFNVLMGELGPALLQRGVMVPSSRILDLMRSADPAQRCHRAEMDGVAADMDRVLGRLLELEEEPMGLRITTL